MSTLNTHLDNLYTKLVKEYNTNQWFKFTSLESFLRTKRDSAAAANNAYLYNDICSVIEFAENDY